MITSKRFLELLAAYSAGAIIGVTGTRLMLEFAGAKGISLGKFALRATGRTGLAVAPPVARGALGVGRAAAAGGISLARKNRAVAGIGALYVLNELGALEPVKETISGAHEAGMSAVMEELQPVFDVGTKAKKKVSNFNKAVKAGMKKVKDSASYGKKGIINAPKKAFAAVTKTVAGLGKRKTPKVGIKRAIAMTPAAKKYKDEILRRKMK